MKIQNVLLISVGLLATAVAAPAYANDDDWGCEVLLCLASPTGWDAIKECHPPIKRLFSELKKRKGKFPQCKQANGMEVKQGFQEWRECPSSFPNHVGYKLHSTPPVEMKVCSTANVPDDCKDVTTYFGYKFEEPSCRSYFALSERRPKPNWFEVVQQGQTVSQKIWW